MYAVGRDKEDEEHNLEASEGGIRCDDERWCRPGREDGCEKLGEEL